MCALNHIIALYSLLSTCQYTEQVAFFKSSGSARDMHRDSIAEFLLANQEVKSELERLQAARQVLQRQINFGKFKPTDEIQRYVDPIDRSIMFDPVTAGDGKVYDRKNITLWIESARVNDEELVSPVTREAMGEELTPNPKLKKDIQQVRQFESIAGVVIF